MILDIPFDQIIANMSDLQIVELQANCCQELMNRYTSVMEPQLGDDEAEIAHHKAIREAKRNFGKIPLQSKDIL
jgi:hypothetical protein